MTMTVRLKSAGFFRCLTRIVTAINGQETITGKITRNESSGTVELDEAEVELELWSMVNDCARLQSLVVPFQKVKWCLQMVKISLET
jgi:hypothetical protein